MDDFDRLLELQLRRKLDAVVAAPVPVRRGRAGSGRLNEDSGKPTIKRTGGIPIEHRLDRLAFVEHF